MPQLSGLPDFLPLIPRKPSLMKSPSTMLQSAATKAAMSRSTSMVQMALRSGSLGKGLVLLMKGLAGSDVGAQMRDVPHGAICVSNFHWCHQRESDDWSPDEYQFAHAARFERACPHPVQRWIRYKRPEMQQNAASLSKVAGWLKLVLKV